LAIVQASVFILSRANFLTLIKTNHSSLKFTKGFSHFKIILLT
jgi:hypothetical protein